MDRLRRPLNLTLAGMKKRSSEKLSGELAIFVREYARKAQRGAEPNDRGYDRKLEQRMKALKPEELSALLNDEEPGDL